MIVKDTQLNFTYQLFLHEFQLNFTKDKEKAATFDVTA